MSDVKKWICIKDFNCYKKDVTIQAKMPICYTYVLFDMGDIVTCIKALYMDNGEIIK